MLQLITVLFFICFYSQGFHTAMYASPWFLTLCASVFPLNAAFRIMDVFICEVKNGWPAFICIHNLFRLFTETTNKSALAHKAGTPPRSLSPFNVVFTAFLLLPPTKTNKFNIEWERTKERRRPF